MRISGDQTHGGELILDGDRAVALVQGWRADPSQQQSSSSRVTDSRLYLPGKPTTRVLLLDVSTDKPRLIEDATYDAQYVSARLVDGTVRLVTTTRPQPPVYSPNGPAMSERQALATNRRLAGRVKLTEVLPQVVRKNASGKVLQRGNAVSCTDTFHARTPYGVSTLLVTTLRPADGLAATDSTAVTTDGDLVYASADRLYVATSRWGTVGPVMPMLRSGSAAVRPAPDEVSTELHAFDTSSSSKTRYVGSGSVPGFVLGRWALSQHEGALRVATTRQPPWNGEQAGKTSSMVVKLDERNGALVETGRVAGLGKTEQIRAVRYFGDIAAVVTFRQTDPLYLIDLSGQPKVLGELKVPGFSTYLHPIGDGLLLGIGQDADKTGMVTGMQASVFDISDLRNPALVDRLRLGNGYTPALEDSRAFTYDPGRRLATFAFNAYSDPRPRRAKRSPVPSASPWTRTASCTRRAGCRSSPAVPGRRACSSTTTTCTPWATPVWSPATPTRCRAPGQCGSSSGQRCWSAARWTRSTCRAHQSASPMSSWSLPPRPSIVSRMMSACPACCAVSATQRTSSEPRVVDRRSSGHHATLPARPAPARQPTRPSAATRSGTARPARPWSPRPWPTCRRCPRSTRPRPMAAAPATACPPSRRGSPARRLPGA